ncbi:hypothetical protein ATO12_16560 [Aquimarina atlantica]|uniref:Uncharacterized protein n=1 Tax=Aquimarina atlantica TaxID=1317122 RepID=A0A023BUF2_9FLAO|nr:DUF6090 family protein [Aquimarina atlantica]EZH73549.1 hypothetical protein ATO12_16560 [Aquimarina atlantica]
MNTRKKHIDWLNHGLEFIVVIIGILIAFQLNKCSAENQQEKTISIHLEQIKKETEINKRFLESALKLGESNLAKIDTIFVLLNQKEDYNRINQLSIELLNLSGAYFRKNAFQNLVESGDIRFIKNFDTKQKIINLYEYYKWVESFDEISRSLYIQDYYPYLKNNFDLVDGKKQDEEIYKSKLFKNILASYSQTSQNKTQKYRDCFKEIERYLKHDKED